VVDTSASQQPEKHEIKANTERNKSRAGFNKRLLKNKRGEEQCFEEARANTGSYTLLVGSSKNFNLLQNVCKADQSSQMDLDGDEEASMDVSMSESFSRSMQNSARSSKPFRKERIESKSEGKILFQPGDVSFGAGLNQTAISITSSTMNDVDNVGLPGRQEEETINTKFAMRELSMMFSSPNFEVDSARRKRDQTRASRIDESVPHDDIRANALFGNEGEGIMLNNSICNTAIEDSRVEERSFAKSKLCKDFESTALEKSQEIDRNDNVGFAIFQDEASLNEDKQERSCTQPGIGFQIYDEEDANIVEQKIEKKFPATDKHRACNQKGIGFQIYAEGNLDKEEQKIDDKSAHKNSRTKRPLLGERKIEETFESKLSGNNDSSNLFESGDTASISDAIALLEDDINPSDDDENQYNVTENDGEETADLSLFNEIFRDGSNQDSVIAEDTRCNGVR
jgi:hypothetical protein